MSQDNAFTYHTDPGHGWLEVPRKMLTELGIDGEITSFSYQDGDDVFLEEDMDSGTFARAYQRKHGKLPDWVELPSDEDSVIRSFQQYIREGPSRGAPRTNPSTTQ